MKAFILLAAIMVLIVALPAAAQVGPKPTDPAGAALWERQQQLKREADRVREAQHRNDLRRQDLSGVAADSAASGVLLDGRIRQHSLDEAEVERQRARIRAERAAEEDRIRRQSGRE